LDQSPGCDQRTEPELLADLAVELYGQDLKHFGPEDVRVDSDLCPGPARTPRALGRVMRCPNVIHVQRAGVSGT
jgi:hypothetical protein